MTLTLATGCHPDGRSAASEHGAEEVREPAPVELAVKATAYSIAGTTASGIPAVEGVVAADPAVLPLGSRIRVRGAGTHSGEYVVADTGKAIRGRRIDIFIEDWGEAVEFGRRSVRVEVLEIGEGRRDQNLRELVADTNEREQEEG